MTEPKVVNAFRDYTHNGTMPSERRSILIGVCDHIDRLAARVQELEDRLAAYTPLPGYNVIHSENTRLREALEWALHYGNFDVAVDNPLHAAAMDLAKKTLKESG